MKYANNMVFCKNRNRTRQSGKNRDKVKMQDLTPFLLIPILICFFLTFLPAAEISVDTRTDFFLLDLKHGKTENLTRIYISEKWKDSYAQFAVKNYWKDDTDTFDVDRAFFEFYREKLTFSLGKQRIYWGTGNIFNYADIFNEIDITRPMEQKDGVKSFRIRYNPDQLSRVELAVSDREKLHNDAAVRCTFTSGRFEYMINTLLWHEDLSGYFPGLNSSSSDLVLEARGEFSFGIWASIDLRRTDLNKNIPVSLSIPSRNNLFMLGADYTFDLNGKSLYTMLEVSRDSDRNSNAAYYSHRYELSDVLSFTQSLMKENTNGSLFFGNALDFVYNDFITLRLEINTYDDFSSPALKRNLAESPENEIRMTFRAVF